jgi:hypothetical protein
VAAVAVSAVAAVAGTAGANRAGKGFRLMIVRPAGSSGRAFLLFGRFSAAGV